MKIRGMPVSASSCGRSARDGDAAVSEPARLQGRRISGADPRAPDDHSDIIFALFDLLGLQFAHRLAGLPDRRLYRLASAGTTPAAQLLAHPLNLDLIRDGWDDPRALRRIAQGRDRHGELARSAPAGRRTQAAAYSGAAGVRAAGQDPVRARLSRRRERAPRDRPPAEQGESLHALHDRTFHGNHGTVRLHTLERQSTQAHCLHLVANAIVYWNTIYIQRALDELGYDPDGDELAALTPTLFEHVNPLGTYDFSTDRPAGQLRPLRAAAAA